MIFRWSPGIHVCLALLVSPVLWSQSNRFAAEEEWYISWGYNRSAYAESTVHMWGESPSGGAFDVTLNDARANDMPEHFQTKVYFHPGLFTIPQFNARFGKKVRPNWWISAGWDHMKYKLKKEWVEAEGFAPSADFTDETPGAEIAWDGDSLYWGPGFNFEHSDGMNFVRFSAEHEHTLWTSKGGNFALRAFEAVGTGLVVCSTDFRWAGERVKNPQRISGFGVGLHAGLRAQFHRRFMLQMTGHGGALSLPWIRLQGPTDAGATQNVQYVEWAFALAYLIGPSHTSDRRGCSTCPGW